MKHLLLLVGQNTQNFYPEEVVRSILPLIKPGTLIFKDDSLIPLSFISINDLRGQISQPPVLEHGPQGYGIYAEVTMHQDNYTRLLESGEAHLALASVGMIDSSSGKRVVTSVDGIRGILLILGDSPQE